MAEAPATPPQETRIVEMVFPDQTNHYGTLFGGRALSLMDKAAFIAASRHARRPVVTASTERIDFHEPVEHGQLAEVVARVVKTGRTSMTVEVDLYAEDLLEGTRRRSTRGHFVFVALGDDRRPTPVPRLPGSD